MRTTTIAACAALCVLPLAARAAETPQVTTNLNSIDAQAQNVASGRVRDKAGLEKAARQIAIDWASAERILVGNPDVIVETKIANRAIRQYESVYAKPDAAKTSARDVVSAIASLRTDMAPPSPSPAAAPSDAASAAPSEAPSTAPSP